MKEFIQVINCIVFQLVKVMDVFLIKILLKTLLENII